jgi:hypothetical protein
MAGSTISSTVTNGVTLGYGAYPSPLSITSQGKSGTRRATEF